MTHSQESPIRFAVVGLDHRHIYDLVAELINAGAQCAGFCTTDGGSNSDPRVLTGFQERFPALPQVDHPGRFYENREIDLIVTAAVPCQRADVALDAMQHGKDVLADKPGITSAAHLAAVEQMVAQTGRIFSICFSERHTVPAVQVALQMVQRGDIGRVVQTMGLGPHRLNAAIRPDWFFDTSTYGGILVDIASHQIDQFLMFSGCTQAQVAYAYAGHFGHDNGANSARPATPATPAGFQDFGEIVLQGQGPDGQRPRGYVRVDWFTPDAMPTWGDGRFLVVGSAGSIELRKYVDIAGRAGSDHLFVTTHTEGPRHIDCSGVPLTYFKQLLHDVRYRTATAMDQNHVFTVCRLALQAQAFAA